MSKSKINTYTCKNSHVTVTIDSDEGTTPMMISCPTNKCNLPATSSFYRCDQTLKPEYEWFKPKDTKGLSVAMREHVDMGGLVMRSVHGHQVNIPKDNITVRVVKPYDYPQVNSNEEKIS